MQSHHCGVCKTQIEGTKARGCPGRKCSTPICLECDPLPTSLGKVVGAIGTVADVITGDFAGLASDIAYDTKSNLIKEGRVRCTKCLNRDRKEDRILISGVTSFFTAFLLMPILGLIFPLGGLGIYILGYVFSFAVILYLLVKFYSAVEQYFQYLDKLPKPVKNVISIAGASMAGGLIVLLLFSSGSSDIVEHEIVDTWYSSVESIEFESNGEVNHSGEDVVGWRLQNGDLMLQFSDDDEYEYYHKFLISEPYIFIAPYTGSGTVLADDCVVLSLDEDAQNESYWDEANIKAPEWCNVN